MRSLKAISKRADLLNPNQVKAHISNLEVSESRKERLVIYLTEFYEWKKIARVIPRYRRVERLPWIPTEEEVNTLISALGKKSSCFTQILKETGVRPDEAWNLRWIDVDVEKGAISVLPEKDSNSRICKVSSRTIGMMSRQSKQFQYVFRNSAISPYKSLDKFRSVFCRQRMRVKNTLMQSFLAREMAPNCRVCKRPLLLVDEEAQEWYCYKDDQVFWAAENRWQGPMVAQTDFPDADEAPPIVTTREVWTPMILLVLIILASAFLAEISTPPFDVYGPVLLTVGAAICVHKSSQIFEIKGHRALITFLFAPIGLLLYACDLYELRELQASTSQQVTS